MKSSIKLIPLWCVHVLRWALPCENGHVFIMPVSYISLKKLRYWIAENARKATSSICRLKNQTSRECKFVKTDMKTDVHSRIPRQELLLRVETPNLKKISKTVIYLHNCPDFSEKHQDVFITLHQIMTARKNSKIC